MRLILLCGILLMLASCAVCRLVSGGPVKVGPPIPLELPAVPLSLPPLEPDASSEDLRKAIQRRNQEITLLNGRLGELVAANKLDRKTMQENQDAHIREILYWISGICLAVSALTLIAGFIPMLQLFRGTLWGIAAGAAVTAAAAYALAPALIYVRYMVWGCIALGAVGGVVVLLKLYRTTLAAKLAAGLADRLEHIDPTDLEAIQAAKDEFAALQAHYGVVGLTKNLRDRVIKKIPDRALEKLKALEQKI